MRVESGDDKPRRYSAEWKRCQHACRVRRICHARELEADGEQRRDRSHAEPEARARRGYGRDAERQCQDSANKSGHVETQASRADGQLTAMDVERSFGALMAHETAGPVSERCRARDRGNRRGDRQRREHHRGDPQQQAENEKAGERQRWPPPEE
jgi:hypothetical protein